MTSLTESDEFKDLHTLMHQLSICGTDSTVHVDCVLCLNNITENCTEIGNLLEKCFKLNGIDKKPEQKLTNCLTRLTNVVFEALIEFLKKSDRFEELRLWTVILKVLTGSFALHSNMWINASSPEKVSTYFKSTLAKRGKDDSLYKKFTELAELSKFLEMETGSEAYLAKLKKMFLDFCDPKYNNYSLDVEELEKNIPAEFKFSKDLFEELLGVEGCILNREQSDESLKAFYKLLFFVFEHSVDKAQFCQMYADQDRYTDEQQKLRDAATRDLLFGSMAKFIGMAVTLENTQLFHWLYVMNPKFPFLANADLYKPLPVLPSEKVKSSQKSNSGSDQQLTSKEDGGVRSSNSEKPAVTLKKVALKSVGKSTDAKLKLPKLITKESELLSNEDSEVNPTPVSKVEEEGLIDLSSLKITLPQSDTLPPPVVPSSHQQRELSSESVRNISEASEEGQTSSGARVGFGNVSMNQMNVKAFSGGFRASDNTPMRNDDRQNTYNQRSGIFNQGRGNTHNQKRGTRGGYLQNRNYGRRGFGDSTQNRSQGPAFGDSTQNRGQGQSATGNENWRSARDDSIKTSLSWAQSKEAIDEFLSSFPDLYC